MGAQIVIGMACKKAAVDGEGVKVEAEKATLESVFEQMEEETFEQLKRAVSKRSGTNLSPWQVDCLYRVLIDARARAEKAREG